MHRSRLLQAAIQGSPMQIQSTQAEQNLARFLLKDGTAIECDISNLGKITNIIASLGGVQCNNFFHSEANSEAYDVYTCTLTEHINNIIRGIRASKDGTNRSKALSISRLEKIGAFLIRKRKRDKSDRHDRLASSLSMSDTDDIEVYLEKFLEEQTGKTYKSLTMTMYFQLFNRIARMAAERDLVRRAPKIKYKHHSPEDPETPVLHKEDLQELLNGWIYKDYNFESTKINPNADSWKFWLIPLGMFTGARLNELCQLNVRDISKDSKGIWILEITDKLHTQNCKTTNSKRRIPLHPTLIEMGFLDFWAEQKERFGARTQLFTELTYSKNYHYSRQPSRFFSGKNIGDGYMGKLMIPQDRQTPSFRSLRRTFAETLAIEDTPISCIATLLGHQDGKTDTTLKHYVKRISSQRKLSILVENLIYDIDFSHIHWRNYKPLLESQRNRALRGRRA